MLFKSLLTFSLIASVGTLTVLKPLGMSHESKTNNREGKKTEIATTTQLSNSELATIAQAITVQVYVGEYRGSGILITRENNTYTVITNAHVVDRGNIYHIETKDGIKHTATLISQDDSETVNDLASLQFNSSNKYQIAKVGNSSKLSQGEEVLAAGFPFDADQLNITLGEISLLADKSLEGGYQIGFTNETRQGMSGGVLLNTNGELIGVLGKGKGAIFDTAYTYQDGTNPTTKELETLKDVSFSIPIIKVAELSPQLANILSQPSINQTPKSKQYTGIVGEVDKIAEQITVRIDNLNNKIDNGSGVIIAKQGNSYYVATAKHVLCTNVDTSKCEANGQHQIVTPDGATHKLDYQTVQALGKWLDVAVFRFKSSNNYSVATIGTYDVGDKWVFVSGFPGVKSGSTTKPSRLLTGGLIRKEDEQDFVAKDVYSLKSNGKGLVYTNISYGGMSGGAVLDTHGRLVGINTGAENEIQIDDEGNYEQLSLGNSLGVTIQDFLGLVETSKMGVKRQWLQIETTPPSEIVNVDTNTIRKQLLTTTEPIVNGSIVAWMNYGNQLWRYQRYAEAVSAFEQVIELDPNFDKAYYAMGLAFWSQKDYQQAVTALSKATKINPSPYYYWRYLGSSYLRLKNYDRALFAYNAAIEKNPKDFVLYVERGDVLLYSKNYIGAIESCTQAIKLNPDHPWSYNNRGNAYYRAKKYQKAIADYSKAIEISPQDAKAYSNRGNVYAELKQYEKAFADYHKAIEINSQLADAYYNIAVAYTKSNQHKKAIANFNKVIELKPYDAQGYYNRGLNYVSLKQYIGAIADYTQAIKINPQYADAYFHRGNTYGFLKQYDRAIADYNKVLELDPNYVEAYSHRSFAYFLLKQYESAIADIAKVIEINNPKDAQLYYRRGLAYINLQQYEKAIADFTKVIEIKKPKDAQIYYYRGLAYTKLKQYESAIVDYKRAIEINPQFVQAYLDRGLTYHELKQHKKAIADFSQVLAINPQSGTAYLGRGVNYGALGNLQQARQDLEQADAIFDPQKNPQRHQMVQQALNKLSQLEAQQ